MTSTSTSDLILIFSTNIGGPLSVVPDGPTPNYFQLNLNVTGNWPKYSHKAYTNVVIDKCP